MNDLIKSNTDYNTGVLTITLNQSNNIEKSKFGLASVKSYIQFTAECESGEHYSQTDIAVGKLF